MTARAASKTWLPVAAVTATGGAESSLRRFDGCQSLKVGAALVWSRALVVAPGKCNAQFCASREEKN
jgi:hypothetical protein